MTESSQTHPGLEAHRAGDYGAGRSAAWESLGQVLDDALTIKRRLSGSEWADRHGVLPQGTGAETGPIKLYGYQRAILDAMCDPTIPLVTVCKAARVGYTRLLLLATGYHLEQDPTSCIIAQPTIVDAEDFGRSEIAPMLKETESLARLIRPQRRGEARDTLTDIFLANGAVLRLRGAASDDAFRRYAARFQAADEIDGDGWTPGDTKSQGDKLRLLWMRGLTYWNRKQIRGSTPLIAETSRIEAAYLESDQRRYFVPCPFCNEMQYLEWGGPEADNGIKWEAKDGKVQSVWYVCQACKKAIGEGHKVAMDAAGEWRPTAEPTRPGHVGFHAWAGMSLHPGASWTEMVQEWLDAQSDPATKVQPFVNTWLGRSYKLTYGQELKVEHFANRREAYPAEMPPGVLFLTAGCDVQSGQGKDPRIEVSVYGWGRGAEAWLIGHFLLKGDPAEPAVWQALDALLKRTFKAIDGRQYPISAAAIDSGGHNTSEVYTFTAERDRQTSPRIWAIKGASEQKGRRRLVWPRKPSRGKGGATVYLIGGNAARDFVYRSLVVKEHGPRFVHFPEHAVEGGVSIDSEWFTQLTRERLVIRKGGFTEWEKPGGAHEAGVCLAYAFAAVCGLQMLDKRYLKAIEAGRVVIETEAAPVADAPPDQQPEPTAAKTQKPKALEKPVERAAGEKIRLKRRTVRSNFMRR